jgi:hypothetical protein
MRSCCRASSLSRDPEIAFSSPALRPLEEIAMTCIKYIVPALAALALAACATGPEKAAGDAQVARVGPWQVKPNNPFRTEEGPIEAYDEAADRAIFAARNKRPVN